MSRNANVKEISSSPCHIQLEFSSSSLSTYTHVSGEVHDSSTKYCPLALLQQRQESDGFETPSNGNEDAVMRQSSNERLLMRSNILKCIEILAHRFVGLLFPESVDAIIIWRKVLLKWPLDAPFPP